MSRRKKKLHFRPRKQWFCIELYNPVGWLKQKVFFIRVSTHLQAERVLKKSWPKAEILSISSARINEKA